MSKDKAAPKPDKIDPLPVERAAIGYALIFPGRYAQMSMLKPAHFSDRTLATVWSVIQEEIDRRGTALTPGLVAEGLVRRGGGTLLAAKDLMVECQDEARNAPDPETAGATFRDQLLDAGYRRKAKQIGGELALIAEEAVSLAEVRGSTQDLLFDLMNYETAAGFVSTEHALQDELERLRKQEVGAAPGLPSGIPEVDEVWLGAAPGDFVVIAARPSVGKTSIGTQLAIHWTVRSAATQKIAPGIIFSLEMDKQSLLRRMACQIARIDLDRVQRKSFQNDDAARYVAALKLIDVAVRAKLLEIVDSKSLDGRVRPKSITDIVAETRHYRNRQDIKWIMVDYIQRVHGIRKKGETRELEVARTSDMLKCLAQDLNIPVIAMAQLKRPDKDRLKKRPMIHELRESGSIEADADAIIMLHNWVYVDDNKPAARGERENAEVIIGKQRSGKTGRIDVDFQPPSGTFAPRTREVNSFGPVVDEQFGQYGP